MYVNPVNPIIKKTLGEFLQKELAYGEQSFDYDGVVYQIIGEPDNSRVLFSFKCHNGSVIAQNGVDEMLEAEYAAYKIPREEWLPDYDVTLAIGTGGFPKTQKVKKSMTEEEQEAIRKSNEEIRSQRQAKIDEICSHIAMFKRNYIGAPIRRALL
jgi:hypothetical protein